MPRNWKATSFALGRQRDARLCCCWGRVLNATCLSPQTTRRITAPQGWLGDQVPFPSQVSTSCPHRANPGTALQPLLAPGEGSSPAVPRPLLQHRAAPPEPLSAGARHCSGGCWTQSMHRFCTWLEESRDVNSSGKHPGSQQSPLLPFKNNLHIHESYHSPQAAA